MPHSLTQGSVEVGEDRARAGGVGAFPGAPEDSPPHHDRIFLSVLGSHPNTQQTRAATTPGSAFTRCPPAGSRAARRACRGPAAGLGQVPRVQAALLRDKARFSLGVTPDCRKGLRVMAGKQCSAASHRACLGGTGSGPLFLGWPPAPRSRERHPPYLLGLPPVSAARGTHAEACAGLALSPLAGSLGTWAQMVFLPLHRPLVSDHTVGAGGGGQHDPGACGLGSLQSCAGTCRVTLWGTHTWAVCGLSPCGFCTRLCLCHKLPAPFPRKGPLCFASGCTFHVVGLQGEDRLKI